MPNSEDDDLLALGLLRWMAIRDERSVEFDEEHDLVRFRGTTRRSDYRLTETVAAIAPLAEEVRNTANPTERYAILWNAIQPYRCDTG